MEVDRAVFFSLSARVWQFFAGPVTMLLIVQYFTPELQGYYYTFWSLLALQNLVDLGFQWVILYTASHEWAHLQTQEDRSVTGDPAALGRLASLIRLVLKWYSAAALFFVAAMGTAGVIFFSQKSDGVVWMTPWLFLVVLTGLSLCLLPLIAVLEGCNQVRTVNLFRLAQAVTGNLVVWTSIWLGAGLWVAVVVAGTKLAWDGYLVGVHYRHFWTALCSGQSEARMEWRSDVWPLQWRIAVQSVFQYFSSQLFTPIMFWYHTAALAGQMGMTWTVLTALQAASFAWVQTRMPLFGMLIARGDFRELDRVFFRLTKISLCVVVAGGTVLSAIVLLINVVPFPLADRLASRLLSPLPTFLFSLGVMLTHLVACLGVYVRAHKQDPFLLAGSLSCAAIGFAVWYFGSRFNEVAVAAAFLVVVACIEVPWTVRIWYRSRLEWHQQD